MMQNKKGLFITVEGIEGAGKSTAIQFLQQKLAQTMISFILTREPGGTEIAESIRKILLQHYTEKMTAHTELLLFFAARAQHIETVIKPALQAKQWLICDRFTEASYAYQGGGRQIDLKFIAQLEKQIQADLQPDVTILLDLPIHMIAKRISQRNILDRIEQEQLDFFQRVREVYLQRAALFSKRFHVIDASQNLNMVKQQLNDLLSHLIQAHT